MLIIPVNAQRLTEDHRVMGTLLTDIINNTRNDGWCKLVVSGNEVETKPIIRKVDGILIGFGVKKGENWIFKNGHKPIRNQHIYKIERTISGKWFSTSKMVCVCAEDILNSDEICGLKFAEIFEICIENPSCELLISGKKERKIRETTSIISEMLGTIEDPSKQNGWSIQPIENPVCSEHQFFEIH